MNDRLAIPSGIATAVALAGLVWWFIAFVSAWGLFAEGLFFGVAIGGLISAVFIGLLEPVNSSEEP